MKERAPAGSGWTSRQGYRFVGTKREHIAIAEKAIGHPLPAGVEMHHWNEDKDDNRNENLVVCPDKKYHALLHKRARALDACGNASWRPCVLCKRYDDVNNMKQNQASYRHAKCHSEYMKHRNSTKEK